MRKCDILIPLLGYCFAVIIAGVLYGAMAVLLVFLGGYCTAYCIALISDDIYEDMPATTDPDGAWLKKHWRDVHSRKLKKLYCYMCDAWISTYICSNPESDYFGSEVNGKFGCDAWI